MLFGCGGHARSVADILLKIEPTAQLFFVDKEGEPKEMIMGFPVIATFPDEKLPCFIAVGDNQKRRQLWEKHDSKEWITICAPSAHIGHLSKIEKGVFVAGRAHIGPEAQIGKNTIVNTGAVVEHEVVVGAHSHIAPHAAISGRCQIGDNVFIGVGASIKDGVKIGSNITVGAGAVVVSDLLEPGIYVGCPAKRIK